MEDTKKDENIKQILLEIPKVYNMFGSSGKEVANQFEIVGNGFTLFQSYRSPIALKKDGKVYLFKDWDYSTTTGKYRNKFLGETKQQTIKKLQSRQYIAVDFDIKNYDVIKTDNSKDDNITYHQTE